MSISAVILSAGEGRRMNSSLPKALHPVGGKPILARILKSLQGTQKMEGNGTASPPLIKDFWVITQMAESLVHPIVRSFKATPISQKSHKGTAGAIMQLPFDQLQPYTLIINGDHPLIFSEDLHKFCKQALSTDLAVGTCFTSEPKKFGRVVRSGDQIEKIVEHFDLTEETAAINEINSGIILVKTDLLEKNIKLITNDNAKEEYLLTDLISLFFKQGLSVKPIEVSIHMAHGVNTQEDLALANSFVFDRKVSQLMEQGVIFPNPHQVHIEEDVQVGSGSIIYPGVYLKGNTVIGNFCAIEQNCFIFDSQIAHSVHVKSSCYIEKAQVHSKSIVGPFAHLRPQTVIEKECKVGNFVEMKNTVLGEKSKASHMSYLGDSNIGKEVNIGCGTVTCNYAVDRKKYKTEIKDESFIGSGSMLIAPVTIGKKSIVGAGSVIDKDVPAENLALTRATQQNKKRKK